MLLALLAILMSTGPGAGRLFPAVGAKQAATGDQRQMGRPDTEWTDPEDDWSWWELIGQAAAVLAFVMMLLFCLFTRRPPAVRMYQTQALKRKTVRSRRRK